MAIYKKEKVGAGVTYGCGRLRYAYRGELIDTAEVNITQLVVVCFIQNLTLRESRLRLLSGENNYPLFSLFSTKPRLIIGASFELGTALFPLIAR